MSQSRDGSTELLDWRSLVPALTPVLFVAFFTTACSDTHGPEASNEGVSSTDVSTSLEQSSDLANLETVAKIVAATMSDESVRASVLRAMQKSSVHEHKLIFQEFLSRPAGARLITQAVAHATADERRIDFGHLVESLPGEMDFYLPDRNDRQYWTGDAAVGVAALMDPDRADRVRAFTPEGDSFVISSPQEFPGTLFVLHPAEPHVSDGPPAGSKTIESPRAAGVSTSDCPVLEDNGGLGVYADCYGGGGGGGGTSTPDTYVTAMDVDFGDGGWGNVEVYFITYYTDGTVPDTSYEASFDPNYIWTGTLKIHPADASLSALVAEMWEADSGLNGGDDYKGASCLALDAGGACVQEYIDGIGDYLSLDVYQIWAQYYVDIW